MKKLTNLKNIADTNLEKLDMSQESKLRLKNQVKKGRHISFKKLSFIGIPTIATLIAFFILFNSILNNSGAVKVFAQDLMQEIIPQKVGTVELKDEFIKSTADFSVDLFKNAYTKEKNSLVSPTSVYLALAMTANGADGKTLTEFETLLSKYGINIADLNAYYNTLSQKLTKDNSGKLAIANSIWYSQNIDVKMDFLQTNADYYNASAYKADFNDPNTVKDINNWVKLNTGNTIDKIIDKADPLTVMTLINAVYFEDKWMNSYKTEDVQKDDFQLKNGTKQSVDFMNSEESSYLKDDKAEGFTKSYANGKYSFVALLPNKNISIDDYISSLSGDSFINILKNQSQDTVLASLPKFKSEYNIELVDPLKQLGLNECFNPFNANFTKMINIKRDNIYVSSVLHKTFITVDTEGTKAAAVTKVEVQIKSSIMMPEPLHKIILNRPFVYAIIDTETNLPIFMGTMMNP
jgi:serpin B